MPELPEVETTCRGIQPHLQGRVLEGWRLRQPQLRWPVVLPGGLRGQRIATVRRRAKYLIFELQTGALIVHLGMSGSLRLVRGDEPAAKHDHLDLLLDSGKALRLTDPRRFGSVHFQAGAAEQHWLLARLGIEPLSEGFDGQYLHRLSRRRKVAVKNLLMDGRIVVGVGNIYANEALFLSGIRPRLAAGGITRSRYAVLADEVKSVLRAAIDRGGTTFRDFVGSDGRPGYFSQELKVYGRSGQPCVACGTVLSGVRSGQRATVYCKNCQR
jgi:formamidopyrimidine-DNA glycosylase